MWTDSTTLVSDHYCVSINRKKWITTIIPAVDACLIVIYSFTSMMTCLCVHNILKMTKYTWNSFECVSLSFSSVYLPLKMTDIVVCSQLSRIFSVFFSFWKKPAFEKTREIKLCGKSILCVCKPLHLSFKSTWLFQIWHDNFCLSLKISQELTMLNTSLTKLRVNQLDSEKVHRHFEPSGSSVTSH